MKSVTRGFAGEVMVMLWQLMVDGVGRDDADAMLRTQVEMCFIGRSVKAGERKKRPAGRVCGHAFEVYIVAAAKFWRGGR